MENAGRAERPDETRGWLPQRRAKIVIARLRDKGVKPERLLAIHLAVSSS